MNSYDSEIEMEHEHAEGDGDQLSDSVASASKLLETIAGGKSAESLKNPAGNSAEYQKTIDDLPDLKIEGIDIDDLRMKATQAITEVNMALIRLTPRLQQEYGRLYQPKGYFSKEQLSFIHRYCPDGTTNAASRYNEANQALMRLLVGNPPAPSYSKQPDGPLKIKR